MIYQAIITNKIQNQLEHFDPYPYSNTYFPPSQRLHSSTEVYDTPQNVPTRLREKPDVGFGDKLRQVQFQYNKVEVPKMSPSVVLQSATGNDNPPSYANVSFQVPKLSSRTTLNIQPPDATNTYLVGVPVSWNYLTKSPEKIQTDIFVSTNPSLENPLMNSWITLQKFENNDYLLIYTQVSQNDTTTPQMILVKKLVGDSWNVVYENNVPSSNYNFEVGAITHQMDLPFTQDVAHTIYEPSSQEQYELLTKDLDQVSEQQSIINNSEQSFMISSPYSYYEKTGKPEHQGFLLSGFRLLYNNKTKAVKSNLSNTPYPTNEVRIGTDGFQLTQHPRAVDVGTGTSVSMGGFPLTSPRLLLEGQTSFHIPAPIAGQPRIQEVLLKVESGGSFKLVDATRNIVLVDLPQGGNGTKTLKLVEPSKGETWNLGFTWTEPQTRMSGENYMFKVSYQTTDQFNKQSTMKVIPSQMLSAPESRFLSFTTTGTQRDSALTLTTAKPITYKPSNHVGNMGEGDISYIPKIEWEMEPLTAPMNDLWSMTGDTTQILSSMVRIKSKPMRFNDAIYYLSYNPETKRVGVSLDGGGYQSAWQLVPTAAKGQYMIRTGFEEVEQPFLCYQSMRQPSGEVYLLRSNVLMGKDGCPWKIVYSAT